ncbi:MAG: hypothetical protein CMH28_10045 [Micavibrio sp.]|nr:hypothetical protein [Micavibrio sp.]|tara:strand:+ start:700 stop:1764 length:1065 start_codon:yes stop_codon:yes gene_type:complete
MNSAVEKSRYWGLTDVASDLDFTGQNVLVTGGAAGIGADKVKALHTLGANVITLDIQEKALEELKAKLGGDRITTIPCDLSQNDPKAYEELAKKITEASPNGLIDGYIMNAGVVKLTDINTHNTVANTPMSEFEKMVQINALSHIAIYQQLREHFAHHARLLVTSSPIVGRADPKTAGYSVTKRMMDSFANNIAAELSGTDMMIAGYVPPPVQNFLRRDLKPNEPLHAHPHGEDIVEIPLRLLSPTVRSDFNGKVIAYGYDNLREKSGKLADGRSYDYMPRNLDDNGFIYNLFTRDFDNGGGDGGDLFMQGYSTHAMREIMDLGTTPDMDTDQLLKDVYKTPDHIAKNRNQGPK